MLAAFCEEEGFASGEELHEALRRDLKAGDVKTWLE